MAQAQRKAKKESAGSMKLFAYIAAVVVAAGVVGFGVTSLSSADPEPPASTVIGGVVPSEYQKITATGDALEPLADATVDPALGKTAPTLQGYNFAGAPVNIQPGANGQAMLLVFLAHWCPHCNAEVPRLNEWRDKGLVPENLRVVGITTSSRKDQANWPPSNWVSDMKWQFETLADSEENDAAFAYGVDGFPFMVLVNGEGKVVSRHSGEMEVGEIQEFISAGLASA
jgi:cytochrome c biogenesis protein CcmG/thiol:disulfide interchange protein DsbE